MAQRAGEHMAQRGSEHMARRVSIWPIHAFESLDGCLPSHFSLKSVLVAGPCLLELAGMLVCTRVLVGAQYEKNSSEKAAAWVSHE